MSYLEDQLSQVPPSKQWISARIAMLKTAPDGAKFWLRDLSKNGFEHAEAVEEYVGKILLESNVRLCAEEIYLLLHAIYTHDVGYRANAREHPKASHDAILANPEAFFIHDVNLGKAIAWIALSHGLDDLSDIPDAYPVDFLSKTLEFDLRFLGALLLLSDEMDQAYLRVFNRTGQEGSPRNSVYHVEIGPQIIKLKTKPASREQWTQLKETADAIQQRLTKIMPILARRAVRLEQVDLYPMVWAEEEPHEEEVAPTSQVAARKHGRRLLFILDRTVLGAEVLQRMHLESGSVTVVPVVAAHEGGYPLAMQDRYSAIIWMLGEDFELPVAAPIIEVLLSNTANGGGLVLFPFVAWSVSQGINDEVQDALPVALSGRWLEGQQHTVSVAKPHKITTGIKPFTIENTFECLRVKQGAESILSDSSGRPFLVIGSYGEGRVAYVNVCSHLCQELGRMVSPWQQDPTIGEIIARTVAWSCTD